MATGDEGWRGRDVGVSDGQRGRMCGSGDGDGGCAPDERPVISRDGHDGVSNRAAAAAVAADSNAVVDADAEAVAAAAEPSTAAACGTLTAPTTTDADAAVAVSPYRVDRAQSALPLRKRARFRVVPAVSGNPRVASRPARQLPGSSAGPLRVEDGCSWDGGSGSSGTEPSGNDFGHGVGGRDDGAPRDERGGGGGDGVAVAANHSRGPAAASLTAEAAKVAAAVAAAEAALASPTCEYCGVRLSSPSLLRQHLVAVHDGESPFPCPQCPQAMPTHESLKQHFWDTHHGHRRFGCSVCGQRFRHRAHAVGHRRKRHVDVPLPAGEAGIMDYGRRPAVRGAPDAEGSDDGGHGGSGGGRGSGAGAACGGDFAGRMPRADAVVSASRGPDGGAVAAGDVPTVAASYEVAASSESDSSGEEEGDAAMLESDHLGE